MQFTKRAWVEIDIDKIIENYNSIKSSANGRKIFAVVKADAYGHGAEMYVKTYESLGADGYCVSNVTEALAVRRAAKDKPVLILGYTPINGIRTLVENKISQAIISYDYAVEVSNELKRLNKSLSCHIKVDTGMSRVGLNARNGGNIDKAAAEVKEISNMFGIKAEGIFTHYSVADSEEPKDIKFTESQYERFCEVVEKSSVDFTYIHCCNSAGIGLQKNDRGNTVRPGIILHGLMPAEGLPMNMKLSPTLNLKSVVGMIKTIKEGDSVSYGRMFTAKKDTKIATVPIGYADGYPRFLSNKGRVLIGGEYADILGKICMDQMAVDVSNIKNVSVGDTVTLIGKDGENEITASDIASLGNTINYEIVCGLSQRIPRIYIKDGKPIKCMTYILEDNRYDS